MNIVYLQLGSNLGEREHLLSDAVLQISNHVGSVNLRSQIYESTPWRVDGQENYLNQIVQVETLFSAPETLSSLLKIENDLGRVRMEKWGERLIDIDIIFYNSEIINDVKITIPHKRMHERAFVLVPLCDIIPNFIHPVFRTSVISLSDKVKNINIFKHAL